MLPHVLHHAIQKAKTDVSIPPLPGPVMLIFGENVRSREDLAAKRMEFRQQVLLSSPSLL